MRAGETPIKSPGRGSERGIARLLLATRELRLVGVDEKGLAVAGNRAIVDDHLLDVRERRKVEHDVEQRMLDDGAKPARTRAALERALGDRREGMVAELELDAFHRE